MPRWRTPPGRRRGRLSGCAAGSATLSFLVDHPFGIWATQPLAIAMMAPATTTAPAAMIATMTAVETGLSPRSDRAASWMADQRERNQALQEARVVRLDIGFGSFRCCAYFTAGA